jgi:hypothetical protein
VVYARFSLIEKFDEVSFGASNGDTVLAKNNGISLNMTKQETIELLDKLEPGIDHTSLKGKELLAKKKQYGIGILKNKQQLVEALQKKAGADLAVIFGYLFELQYRHLVESFHRWKFGHLLGNEFCLFEFRLLVSQQPDQIFLGSEQADFVLKELLANAENPGNGA